MSTAVLVVDDEKDILELIDYNLKRAGIQTLLAETGAEALAIAKRERPAAVVLDLMLPDLDGLEVLRRLRQDPATRELPVLLLTAKSEEIDRVAGFEVGADDYVVKPFSVRELVLRIRVLLRRAPEGSAPTALKAGALKIDLEAHRAYLGEAELQLTLLEFKLLVALVENRGRVQTRERLLKDIWAMSLDVSTRTVDTHVKRLREKLGEAGQAIETVRGVGYRFSES
jgi:two-component system phosphate regulon response regulator PhoB